MIAGELCEFCRHWTQVPCKTVDDAEDCPQNDREPDDEQDNQKR
jgi:hypothetical protein